MSEHDEIESSIAAYVLAAAEPEEADEVRRHLASCASCRRLAARLQSAATVLPLSAGEVAPPPRLKQRILAAAAESRTRPAATTATAPAPAPAPALGPGDVGAGQRRVIRLPLPRFGALQAAVAMLVVAVLGLAGWNGYLTLHLGPGGHPAAVAHFALAGSQGLTGAQATVIDFRPDKVALVQFQSLPQPAPGKVYQLWLIPPGGAPVSAGVFLPETNGSGVVVVSRDLAGYRTMAVTVESGPAGAAQPTQPPQMSGRIA
ncbi:MAG: anti-sigma factor [Candidatus Dormibacteraceae bacterium]